MEKLDKVVRALECCLDSFDACPDCYLNDYDGCRDKLTADALEWLKEQNRLIEELSDHIPCCDNCEGKTVIGERTDKCVYEIEGFDSVLYCAKRGIANCFGYRKKIEELEAKLKESEPVVHAHWERFKHQSGTHGIRCSHCETVNGRKSNHCPECGAVMDEKVFEPTPIGKASFTARVRKRLKQAGIETMEQLEATDKRTLCDIPGFGKQSLLEVEEELQLWNMRKEKNDELLER